MDLTKSEDIRSGGKNTQKNCTKRSYLHNYDGKITHPEPDILECGVKWMLESITVNKASVGDGIRAELFQIVKKKMMMLKWCTKYTSKLGKFRSGHRTGKGQFSSKSQRRAMPKNVQTTTQLHSLHMLAR